MNQMDRQVLNLTSRNSLLSRYFRADVVQVRGIVEAKSNTRGVGQDGGFDVTVIRDEYCNVSLSSSPLLFLPSV
jgi:hypothetical protein